MKPLLTGKYFATNIFKLTLIKHYYYFKRYIPVSLKDGKYCLNSLQILYSPV